LKDRPAIGGQVVRRNTYRNTGYSDVSLRAQRSFTLPDERARVFDAFFFKREGGVGLGLAIVQQIVQSHGGSIEVGESERAGALFELRIPRRRSDAR